MGKYFCSVLHPRQDLQHLTAVFPIYIHVKALKI